MAAAVRYFAGYMRRQAENGALARLADGERRSGEHAAAEDAAGAGAEHPGDVEKASERVLKFFEAARLRNLFVGRVHVAPSLKRHRRAFRRAPDLYGADRGVITLDGRIGAYELRELFPEKKKVFESPKPSQLIEQLLSFVAGKDDVILDSFAGSGTTGHATLALNKADGGQRRFILVETGDYAETLTAERIRRSIGGVKSAKDNTLKRVSAVFSLTAISATRSIWNVSSTARARRATSR